jgi:hypothetical protein
LCLLGSAPVARSCTATKVNRSLVLRVDGGCLLAEKMDGQDSFVDSLTGKTSTLGFQPGLSGMSPPRLVRAMDEIKPVMNLVQQPKWIF